MVGLSQQSVEWRIQFCDRGLDGLDDAPRSGRRWSTDRLVYGQGHREHPRVDSQWSHSELAAEMAAARSRSRRRRSDGSWLLMTKPHRVQGWLTRRDSPEFWQRAADVCGLYLAPGERVVDRRDRDPGQVPQTRHPRRQARPAGATRVDTSATGPRVDRQTSPPAKSLLRCRTQRFRPLLEFLTQIEDSIDPTLTIHIVLKQQLTPIQSNQEMVGDHPRFVVHHTPVHASWLNQVEAFFSILTRKVPAAAIRTPICRQNARPHRNNTATPFKWVYTPPTPHDPRSTNFARHTMQQQPDSSSEQSQIGIRARAIPSLLSMTVDVS